MRIVVPYTVLTPETVERLSSYEAEFYETPADDVYAYWRLFDGWLRDGRDFLIVEGDKSPSDEQIADLDECRVSLICGFSGFAATRFRAELWTDYGDAWLRDGQTPMHWYGMDGAIMAVFQWRGIEPHRHPGEIEHHHVGLPSEITAGTAVDGSGRMMQTVRKQAVRW